MLAAKLGHVSIAKMLLSYGADPGLVNKDGCAAIDIAREFKQNKARRSRDLREVLK
jgi:ankyrin repeat protein